MYSKIAQQNKDKIIIYSR